MGTTLSKELTNKITLFLVVAYFAAFPFGQLLRVVYEIGGLTLHFGAIDVIAGLFVLPYLLGARRHTRATSAFLGMLFVLGFTLVLSVLINFDIRIVVGALYYFRLASYYFFFSVLLHFSGSKKNRANLNKIVAVSLVATTVFGWLQYIFFYDLRSLKYVGWDDHLYRITGTFLDPTYAGLIFVLGAVYFFYNYLLGKNRNSLYLALGFLGTSLFTYSRASFAAALAVLFYLLLVTRKWLFLGIAALFVGVIPLLPRPSSEGVKLERTYSIVSRVETHMEALKITRANPLFGIGFNNYCLGTTADFSSHSCSSSDSSFLTILAAGGVVGFLAMVYFLLVFGGWPKWRIFVSTLLVVTVVHSLFSNGLLYPWVLGLLFTGAALEQARE